MRLSNSRSPLSRNTPLRRVREGDGVAVTADGVAPLGGIAALLSLLGKGAGILRPGARGAAPGADGQTTGDRATGAAPRNGLRRPGIALNDPLNIESELGPEDVVGGDLYVPTAEQTRLTQLIEQRYRESSNARRPHEGRWLESLAFWRGDQWSYWDTRSGLLKSLRNPTEPDRVYAVSNKIKPKIKKLIARAVSGKVTASVSPETALDADIQGTQEARSVLEDLDIRNDRAGQVRALITRACVVGPYAIKFSWDPDALAAVPQLADDLTLLSVSDERVGAIREDMVSCFEMYPDPKAETWDEAEWLIFAKLRPLEYIAKKFKQYGRFVKGDGGMVGPAGAIENLLNNLTNDLPRGGSHSASRSATLLEMWEKPSRAYPKGRFAFLANGVLLSCTDWPYPKLKRFPVAVLQFDEGIETIWGDNAISAAIDPQRARNRGLSKQQEHIKNGDGKILAPRGSEISTAAFKSGRRNEIVYFTPILELNGMKPEFMMNPVMDPAIDMVIRLADADIDDILNVHEVSQGITPPGVTAASAIQNLNDQDQSDAVLFHSGIETWTKQRAEIELCIAAQCYTEARMASVRDTPQASAEPSGAVGMARAGAMSTALLQAGARHSQFAGLMNPSMMGPPTNSAPTMNPSMMGPSMMGGPPSPGGAPPSPGGAPGPDAGAMPGAAPGGMPGMMNPSMMGAPPSPGGAPPSPEDAPRTKPLIVEHLGTGRYIIAAVSSSPKSPAARIQQILDMAQRGMFMPQALPTTIPLLRVMEIEDSDKLIADLVSALDNLNAQNQAAEQQAQQAKDDHDVAMLHAKAQADVEAKQAYLQSQPAVGTNPLSVEQAKGTVASTLAQQNAEHKAEQTVMDAHAKGELAQQAHEHRMIETRERGNVDTRIAAAQAHTSAAAAMAVHEHKVAHPIPLVDAENAKEDAAENGIEEGAAPPMDAENARENAAEGGMEEGAVPQTRAPRSGNGQAKLNIPG